MEAFNDLSTCRDFGNGIGPIPWDKIVSYGLHVGLDEYMLPVFKVIMRKLDDAYRDWYSDKRRQELAVREAELKARSGNGRLHHKGHH